MENENQSLFRTTDFCLASTLIALGFSVQVFDKSNPKKIIFHFHQSQKIEKLISKFWNGTLLVSPRAFHESQRLIKTRMYEES